jgi:hypothetical protein
VNLDLAAGDRDYLAAMLAESTVRGPLIASARQEYQRALVGEQLMVFHYYVSDATAKQIFPAGFNRINIDKLSPDQYSAIIEEVKRRTFIPGQYADNKDDIDECMRYIAHLTTRLAMLGH